MDAQFSQPFFVRVPISFSLAEIVSSSGLKGNRFHYVLDIFAHFFSGDLSKRKL